MATLRRQPPELIFAGYAPFKALHAFLNEFYLPSPRFPHDERSGVGMWIRRDSYRKFETSGSRTARPGSADRSPDDRGRLFVDESLIAISETAMIVSQLWLSAARAPPPPSGDARPAGRSARAGRRPCAEAAPRLNQDPRRPGLNGPAYPPGRSATTGSPEAMASSTTFPNVSVRLANAKISEAA